MKSATLSVKYMQSHKITNQPDQTMVQAYPVTYVTAIRHVYGYGIHLQQSTSNVSAQQYGKYHFATVPYDSLYCRQDTNHCSLSSPNHCSKEWPFLQSSLFIVGCTLCYDHVNLIMVKLTVLSSSLYNNEVSYTLMKLTMLLS